MTEHPKTNLLEQLVKDIDFLVWLLRDKPPIDRDELAHTLSRLRSARRMLSDAERDIEQHLATAMGDDKVVVVEGLGTVERKHSPVKPTWDHERLLPRIAAMSRDERLINERTGEIESDSDAAARVLFECAAISYWRVGKLQERGIDAKEYRSEDSWRASIRITTEGT